MGELIAIDAVAAVTPQGVISPARLLVRDGLIEACDEPSLVPVPAGARTVKRPSATLLPGFIDLQINGALGADFGGADPSGAWSGAQEWFARSGVTTACPTVTSRTREATLHAVASLAAADTGTTRLAGIHLEGPYLSAEKRGAHDPHVLRDADLDEAARILAAGPVAIWTVAPERPGCMELISVLADRHVLVSIGHSDATLASVRAAVDAGARMITHLFNAQRLTSPREPGIPGAFLAFPELAAGLIVDGVHVHPDLVRAMFASAPGRIAAVTDAAPLAGLTPGVYTFEGREIVLSDDAPRLLDGTLAGSSVSMDVVFAGALACSDLGDAVHACSTLPAALLGRTDLGRLQAGSVADVVCWEAGRVLETWRAGTPIYQV